MLTTRAPSWVGAEDDSWPRALLGIRTFEQSVELYGARVRARGVRLQAPLVLLDLRLAVILDDVDRGTARRARLKRRHAGSRQAVVPRTHCFAAQALSNCFSSLHVACQPPGLESTQMT